MKTKSGTLGIIRMKKMGFLFGVVTFLILLSGSAFADCDADCDGPFQTCLNLCRQTTKEDSPQGSTCVNHCFRGLNGCQKRCQSKDTKSDRTGDGAGYLRLASYRGAMNSNAAGANCIDQGLTCVLNGTPCCAPSECKGKFPNTTCR